MWIQTLKLEGFRNLHNQQYNFSPQGNWICGANGSGKTALLEALYILGRGKSFRSKHSKHIITHNHDYFRLIAQLEKDNAPQLLGIEKHPRHHTLRLNGEPLTTLSALARLIPLQIIDSAHFALIDQGPDHRRRFLDYGLFYADKQFLPQWQQYQYALKNRNAALRQQWADHLISPWHRLLSETATTIDRQRQHYLTRLETAVNTYHQQLGGLQAISIHYQRGWHNETDLQTLLDRHLSRDKQHKHTKDGIHRADLRFYADGHDIANYFSRGQQKTLICALILAQAQLIEQDSHTHPIMLIDDLSAELDPARQTLLLSFIGNTNSQWFISSIEPDLPSLSDLNLNKIPLNANPNSAP